MYRSNRSRAVAMQEAFCLFREYIHASYPIPFYPILSYFQNARSSDSIRRHRYAILIASFQTISILNLPSIELTSHYSKPPQPHPLPQDSTKHPTSDAPPHRPPPRSPAQARSPPPQTPPGSVPQDTALGPRAQPPAYCADLARRHGTR